MSSLTELRLETTPGLKFDPVPFRYDPRLMPHGIFSGITVHFGPMKSTDFMFSKIIEMQLEGAFTVPLPQDKRITHILVNIDSQIPSKRIQTLSPTYFSRNLDESALRTTEWILHKYAQLSKCSAPSPISRGEEQVIVLDYRWVDDCILNRRVMGKEDNWNGREIKARYPQPFSFLELASPPETPVEVVAGPSESPVPTTAGLRPEQIYLKQFLDRQATKGKTDHPRPPLQHQEVVAQPVPMPCAPLSPAPSTGSLVRPGDTDPQPVVPNRQRRSRRESLPSPFLSITSELPEDNDVHVVASPIQLPPQASYVGVAAQREDSWTPTLGNTIPAKRERPASDAAKPEKRARDSRTRPNHTAPRNGTPNAALAPEVANSNPPTEQPAGAKMEPEAGSSSTTQSNAPVPRDSPRRSVRFSSNTTRSSAPVHNATHLLAVPAQTPPAVQPATSTDPALPPTSLATASSENSVAFPALIFTWPIGMPMSFHVLGDLIVAKLLTLMIEQWGGIMDSDQSATFIVVPVPTGSRLEGINPKMAVSCTGLGRARMAISYEWIHDSVKEGKRLDPALYRLV